MKIYLRSMSAISVQKPLTEEGIWNPVKYEQVFTRCIDPEFKDFLDPISSRRMSRIIKRAIITSLDAIDQSGISMPEAIITGTGFGCIEDTEKFLEAMVNKGEEFLQPTFFIQSTHNTIGSQIAIKLECHGFNNTHTHRGISFENALEEAVLLFKRRQIKSALVGGHDEMTPSFFTILDRMNNPEKSSKKSFSSEGSTAFMLSDTKGASNSLSIEGIGSFYRPVDRKAMIEDFICKHGLSIDDIDVIMTGINGDLSNDRAYLDLESYFPGKALAYYRHICGEYSTCGAYGLFTSASLLKRGEIPGHLSIDGVSRKNIRRILIYNHCQEVEHALTLVSNV